MVAGSSVVAGVCIHPGHLPLSCLGQNRKKSDQEVGLSYKAPTLPPMMHIFFQAPHPKSCYDTTSWGSSIETHEPMGTCDIQTILANRYIVTFFLVFLV